MSEGGLADRLRVDAERLVVRVDGADGRPWLTLRLLNAVHTGAGPDETLSATFEQNSGEDGITYRVAATSSVWEESWTELRVVGERLIISGGVRGRGSVHTVDLLAGSRPPDGFLPSGSGLRSVVSPNPDHPRRIVRVAEEPATIAVTGSGGEPGVGRWLFTPAPWCFLLSREERTDPFTPPVGEWAFLGLRAPVVDQNFTAFHYRTGPLACWFALDYEGHTEVDGEFRLPDLVIEFGHPDPFAALAAYCREIVSAKSDSEVAEPKWWREPIFCGWGAQNALARRQSQSHKRYIGNALTECTEVNYDRWLVRLEQAGISPGTVVVDDKWAVQYARGVPDVAKWPDLRRWIDGQHASGRRVLLWWKAWDPDGAPDDACIKDWQGRSVAIDPESVRGRGLVATAVREMLAADGLDADGLKVDFTASTPSGVNLRAAGPSWGAALLHELLSQVHRTAKATKPDALIITHCPNPGFADVTDMVRLNDIAWLDAYDPSVDVVPQMRFRAGVVRAALPGLPIDTDGWCMPDLAQWRAYTREQPDLGVPALYYAGVMDGAGEDWTAIDDELLRTSWQRYRSGRTPPR